MLVSHDNLVPPVSAIRELEYNLALSVSTVRCFYSDDLALI